MYGYYDPSIVALSVAVAIIASYTALDMAGRVSASDLTPRKSWIWLVAGAVSMGTGIWSMHFIGMLSFHLPIQVAFDLPITLLSMIIAIAASVIALIFLRQAQLGIRNLIISTMLMGTGIVAMHYTGMFAMEMSPPIRYNPLLFVASVLIAFVASFAALWISFQLRWKHSRTEILAKLGSAGVMGLAISGMHYTGMAAARFSSGSVCLAVTSGGINSTTLAIGVGSVSLLIMSFTLIVSSLDANFSKSIALLARTDGLWTTSRTSTTRLDIPRATCYSYLSRGISSGTAGKAILSPVWAAMNSLFYKAKCPMFRVPQHWHRKSMAFWVRPISSAIANYFSAPASVSRFLLTRRPDRTRCSPKLILLSIGPRKTAGINIAFILMISIKKCASE